MPISATKNIRSGDDAMLDPVFRHADTYLASLDDRLVESSSKWTPCASRLLHAVLLAGGVEEVAERWVLDVLGLLASASVGFVTGRRGQRNATVGRGAQRGAGAARVDVSAADRGAVAKVIAGEEAHATIFSALRFIGLGAGPELVRRRRS